MRPIERGPVPTDKQGLPVVFSDYKDARGYLIERIGYYCSYCGMCVKASLAVEHVLPKSLYPGLEKNWTNFLLSCANCNSVKSDKNIVLTDYFWPDRDNTMRAFQYGEGGSIGVHPDLSAKDQTKAKNTIKLTGLDRRPGKGLTVRQVRQARDNRWKVRKDTWGMAERAYDNLLKNNTTPMRDQIVDVAMAQGYWPVWHTVFQQDSDMLRRFKEAFPGTCEHCFNAQMACVPRLGGCL